MKKKQSNSLLFVTALIGTILLRRKDGASGIGATKRTPRRIWAEVAEAQRRGIDLSDPRGYEGNESTLRKMADGKLSASNSNKPAEERYFNQLRRAYKSIAGTDLHSDESIIRNEYGDVIMVYRDYHLDQLPQKAAEWVLGKHSNLYMDADDAYWCTLADIALGRVKFVWATSGVHRGAQDLVFGAPVPAERKQRISYLASPAKGGQYPEAYAHYLWETISQGTADSQEVSDGVYEAIRDCASVGDARKVCMDQYLQAHTTVNDQLWQDVPF